MWTKLFEVKTAYVAEAWKELLESEALAVRVVPPLESDAPRLGKFELWVPDSKLQVAQEILRKI